MDGLFPDMAVYSLAYDDWVRLPEIDDIGAQHRPSTGIATDRGMRLTGRKTVKVDLSPGETVLVQS